MKLADTRVMSLPKKLLEARLLGLENQLNRRLVKPVAFEFQPELCRNFRREVRAWLDEVQSLRFKPNNRTGSFKFYFDFLFDYPFGGVEVQNMRRILDLISAEYETRPLKSPEEMAEWLRDFHSRLAERLHDGEDVLDLIPE